MHVVRVLIAMVLAGVSFGQGDGSSAVLPQRSFVSGVPFTKQMTNYCGPASLSSLLAYWRVPTDQKDIGSGVYNCSTLGTNAGDMLLYCRDRGLSAYSMNGTITDLKRFISAGYPVIVLQNLSRTDGSGHYRVAVGYDDQDRTITLRDSLQPNLLRLPYDEFAGLWAKRGYWAMLVMPSSKDIFQKALGEDNTVLHMDLAQAYLHKGKYDEAESESTKALSIEPHNSYAKDLLTKAKARTPVKL